MKINAFTSWHNVWIPYIEKYFLTKGHDFKFKVSSQLNFAELADCDVALLCWANKSVVDMTNYFMKFAKKYVVICRSYEVFFGLVDKINWKHVNDCIFVNPAFYSDYIGKLPCRTHFVPNAIDLDVWKLQSHHKSFNIGWVANLNHKKGIDLIPQFMYQLLEKDKRYRLYLAGSNQDRRHYDYLVNVLNKMGIRYSCIFEGKINNIKKWWEDKDYLFTSSVTEGHPNNVIEAMSLGVKPLIHNWRGAEELFSKEFIWNSIDEAVNLVTEDKYDGNEYRKFIKDNYDMWKVYPRLEEIVCAV